MEASGCSLKDVVDVQVFSQIWKLIKIFNEIYGQYFPQNGPTRTTVGIEALPTPIHIEFKVVARKSEKDKTMSHNSWEGLRIIDISPPINEQTAVFPGDISYKRNISLDVTNGDH